MQADRWRQRLIYGLATCILVAATFATYRKSALIAPLGVILTLAYFRRRELLRLAPLFLVLLVVVTSISPGAIGSTVRPVHPFGCDRGADGLRPHVGLRRGAPGHPHPPGARTRLGKLRPRRLPDARLGDPHADDRGRRARPGGVPAGPDRRRRGRPKADRLGRSHRCSGGADRRVGRGRVPRALVAVRRALIPPCRLHIPVHGRARGGGPATPPSAARTRTRIRVAPRLRLDDRDLAPTSLAQEPLLPGR